MRLQTHAAALIVTASIVGAAISGCALPATSSKPEHVPVIASAADEDGTKAAEAALAGLHAAWASKDASTAEGFLDPRHRGGDWGFDDVDRIEFGAITPSPGDVAGYMSNGLGSANGTKESDVRAFRASITYHYKPGHAGPMNDGDRYDYMWFLERDAEGKWLVTDWGF